jgi:hypothetical protein
LPQPALQPDILTWVFGLRIIRYFFQGPYPFFFSAIGGQIPQLKEVFPMA